MQPSDSDGRSKRRQVRCTPEKSCFTSATPVSSSSSSRHSGSGSVDEPLRCICRRKGLLLPAHECTRPFTDCKRCEAPKPSSVSRCGCMAALGTRATRRHRPMRPWSMKAGEFLRLTSSGSRGVQVSRQEAAAALHVTSCSFSAGSQRQPCALEHLVSHGSKSTILRFSRVCIKHSSFERFHDIVEVGISALSRHCAKSTTERWRSKPLRQAVP